MLRAQVESLQDELRRWRALAAHTERLARTGTWELELDSGVSTWSEGTRRIFGVSADAPITLEQAISVYAEPSRARLQARIAEAIETGHAYDSVDPHMLPDGSRRWVRAIGQLQVGPTGVRRLIGVVRDVTEERQAEDRLRHLAGHDPLTGLPNRRLLLETLERAAAAETRGLALLLLDLHRFRDVNDLHGHAAGDALLVQVARRLRAGVRAGDVAARLGGDEFALVLFGVTSEADMASRLGSVLALFHAPAQLDCGAIGMAASIGAVVHAQGAAVASELLRQADIALHHAKRSGAGHACLYDPALGDAIEARLGLLAEVRDALRRDEMEVFYQPIIDLRTQAVRGLEALIRWRHPARGLLGPAAFLPALDDPALSAEIGGFVLNRSLRQMRAWIDAGEAVGCVNVNVSESQLRDGDALFGQVTTLLKAHGLGPDRLKLEILESAFLGHQPDRIVDTLARLQAHGVVVALDDFGTGHASLTHLKQFDVTRIKIDRSFIGGLGSDRSSTAITRAIIDLGRNLGLRVTAEGIEETSQLAALLDAGCDCGQGYLFSRPMPADAVPAFLRRWAAEGAGIIAAARPRPRRRGARPRMAAA